MSRMKPLAPPLLLGFESNDSILAQIARANDGYPPYDIERLREVGDDPERLRITLAVAGFSESELDVSLQANRLVVRGRQAERADGDFLFRGIAARQFQRVFLLAEGMDVLGATLKNGLLSIDLARPEPAQVVKKINISTAQ
ncbi:Hsp20 family protein [Ciceribacter ferrooxidans]|uniref:Hsp20 family protein n=1 Tax=Ciceribacter ferrooxidans TaxID=2509717 RepID=A0A4Q2SVA5_9HYPH|nr:Hsp20 family protein [Ciceribacter ferrooxidans]RYC09955.1 Hsp20 family protein [Ciceribacter ferrooxidans]